MRSEHFIELLMTAVASLFCAGIILISAVGAAKIFGLLD